MRLLLRDVSVAPPGAPQAVLERFSLELRTGEWVALGGPNGCGKTTLLLAAADLRPPRSGERRVESEASDATAPRSSLANGAPVVATVLQDPSTQLFCASVGEELVLTATHLGLPSELVGADLRRIAACLGLSGELERDPRTLSAGRQQLVLLAAALISRPDFLVADEPGAHLDADARERVLRLIRGEVRDGLGVLWATQDVVEAEAADRRIWIGETPATVGEPRAPHSEVADGDALVLEVSPERPGEGPRVRTARGFELRVPGPGITALAGPNGAGKSVLLAVATGVAECPQVKRTRVPPGPGLLVGQYPELQIFEDTVGAEVCYAAVQRGRAAAEVRAEASRRLAELGLGPGFLERRTWELSAGEKRLTLLVAALVAPASFLALDEPTAGLDPARKLALARQVAERGQSTPVLVASQDLAWLAQVGAGIHAISGA